MKKQCTQCPTRHWNDGPTCESCTLETLAKLRTHTHETGKVRMAFGFGRQPSKKRAG